MNAQSESGLGAAGNNNVQPLDEEQLKQAMKRLKLLFIKVRLLRDTIMRMLQPLTQKHRTPEALFNAYVKAVTDAQASVQEFTELMRDEKSQQIFAYAAKSREERPFEAWLWRHKDHPNWYNMDKD